ncbi:MAG: glycine-rich protein, partial [Acidimicrobiia bacterium]
MALALVSGSLVVLADPVLADPPPTGFQEFSTPGAAPTWTVPDGVNAVAVDAFGAQGGGGDRGGLGGRVRATLAVSPGQVLRVYVGGAGAVDTAGVNYGGPAAQGGLGGGGASDIRTSVNVSDRLVVAGGGGGAGEGASGVSGPGGSGGGPSGSAGSSGPCGGTGGTASGGGTGGSNGQFGPGANG